MYGENNNLKNVEPSNFQIPIIIRRNFALLNNKEAKKEKLCINRTTNKIVDVRNFRTFRDNVDDYLSDDGMMKLHLGITISVFKKLLTLIRHAHNSSFSKHVRLALFIKFIKYGISAKAFEHS